MDPGYSANFYFGKKTLNIDFCSVVFSVPLVSQYLSHSVVLCSLQEAAQDVIKLCTVQDEPVGRWDVYSTTPVSPAVFAVSLRNVDV